VYNDDHKVKRKGGTVNTREEYVDPEGRKWISASQVAEIWNERAKAKGQGSNYTRWSVRQRRKDLQSMQTPLGYLYLESDALAVELRPRSSKRPDVAQANKDRAKGKDAEREKGAA
jgi:hypothetical protein